MQSEDYIAKPELREMPLVDFQLGAREEMLPWTEIVTAILPEDKPSYLMGVGNLN